MAEIDTDTLIADMSMYLPSSNVLTDANLLTLANVIITAVGDDDDNYEEVLCKSLKSAAKLNASKSDVDGSGLKKFKYGKTEEEYFKNSKNVWVNWIDNHLSDTCLLFGYIIPEVVDSDGDYAGANKIYINPGDEIDPLEGSYPYTSSTTNNSEDYWVGL